MPEENENLIGEESGGEAAAPFTDSVRPADPIPKMPVARQLSLLAVVLVGMFSFGAFSIWFNDREKGGLEQNAAVGNIAVVAESQGDDDQAAFNDLNLNARAAIVIDVRTDRVLFESAADLVLPLASITKLMTTLVASEIVEDGATISITEAAVRQDGESGLSAGDVFSYQKLSDIVLLTSSNDGAYALSAAVGKALDPDSPDTAFVKAMNVRAKELGLTSTYFRNPTGLDISESEAGAYGTAREVAKLMEYILGHRPEMLEATTRAAASLSSESGGRFQAENTNPIINAIPTTIGSKTGYTTLAGGNLVVAFDAGLDRPVIVVVLGSTHQGRFSDVLGLVEAARVELQREH